MIPHHKNCLSKLKIINIRYNVFLKTKFFSITVKNR